MATIPIIGNVTVSGAWKEISEGYVNIKGVWKPIVETYVNVNGVWKNAWKELYTWKKYNVVTTESYAVKKSDTTTTTKYTSIGTSFYAAASYTFDKNTGTYTLDSPTLTRINAMSTSKKYFSSSNSADQTSIREFVSYTGTQGNFQVTYYKLEAELTTSYSRGTYISDVTSESSSAYPTNGRHSDGYWYVKQ